MTLLATIATSHTLPLFRRHIGQQRCATSGTFLLPLGSSLVGIPQQPVVVDDLSIFTFHSSSLAPLLIQLVRQGRELGLRAATAAVIRSKRKITKCPVTSISGNEVASTSQPVDGKAFTSIPAKVRHSVCAPETSPNGPSTAQWETAESRQEPTADGVLDGRLRGSLREWLSERIALIGLLSDRYLYHKIYRAGHGRRTYLVILSKRYARFCLSRKPVSAQNARPCGLGSPKCLPEVYRVQVYPASYSPPPL